MPKDIKWLILIGVGGMIGLQLLGDFIPSMADTASVVTDNTSNPTMLRTLFGYWWLLPTGALVAVVMKSFNGIGGGKRFSRRRR